MNILVTGAAGFIGYHVCKQLLTLGHRVMGLDSLNEYYDVSIKYARLAQLQETPGFRFIRLDLANPVGLAELFQEVADHHEMFQQVVHLAAQAGVRYAMDHPRAYIDSNVIGFFNILEECRKHSIEHLVYASSSSVYGANTQLPFSVHQSVDHPLSLYAATKKSNELLAHTYSHLFRLPTTGLRFFTVYGPWGRPDMALFKFTQNILAGQPIEVYNYGHHKRDFTYVDDIVSGVIKILAHIPTGDVHWSGDNPNPSTSSAPWRIFNIGNSQPIELMRYIETLEKCLGRTAQKIFLPLQPGDVPDTHADVDDLVHEIGYCPEVSVEEGIVRFVDWYCGYYGVDR